MFGANQYATVTSFGVRVKDERENDRNHLIEVGLSVPLHHDLADEIMPQMARDLFQEISGEWQPKPEIKEAVFNLTVPTQLLTVKPHPDEAPIFQASGVSIRKVRSKKTEAGTFALHFTATWQMGADNEAMSMIRALKSGVYLSMDQQQPDLLDPGQAPANDQVAAVDADGTATVKKGKGRPKKARKLSPEAEDEAQRQHAQTVGDDAPADAAAV